MLHSITRTDLPTITPAADNLDELISPGHAPIFRGRVALRSGVGVRVVHASLLLWRGGRRRLQGSVASSVVWSRRVTVGSPPHAPVRPPHSPAHAAVLPRLPSSHVLLVLPRLLVLWPPSHVLLLRGLAPPHGLLLRGVRTSSHVLLLEGRPPGRRVHDPRLLCTERTSRTLLLHHAGPAHALVHDRRSVESTSHVGAAPVVCSGHHLRSGATNTSVDVMRVLVPAVMRVRARRRGGVLLLQPGSDRLRVVSVVRVRGRL